MTDAQPDRHLAAVPPTPPDLGPEVETEWLVRLTFKSGGEYVVTGWPFSGPFKNEADAVTFAKQFRHGRRQIGRRLVGPIQWEAPGPE